MIEQPGRESIEPTVTARTTDRRAMTAGAVGNFVEFYDWTIYGYLAPVFASQMFPSDNEFVSLLLAFSTFGVGYLMRPLGSIVLGRYADTRGRRDALSVSILLMCGGSFVIALLPAYHSIGVVAPLLLVAARLVQGFSAGGEGGASSSFLVEYAHPRRRAVAGSWRDFSTGVSILCALGFAAVVTSSLSREDLAAWGWRLPFLVGGLLGIFGFYLRRRMTETPVFAAYRASSPDTRPLRNLARRQRRTFLLVVLIGVMPTVAFMSWQVYLPTYVAAVTSMPLAAAQRLGLIGLVVYLCCLPVMARLADRVGRRPVLITFACGSALWAYPTFVLIDRSWPFVLLVVIVGNVLVALMAGCITATMAEQFPTATRSSGVAVTYALGVSVVGGTFPVLVTYLASVGLQILVFCYVALCAAVSGVVYWVMPETRDRTL